MYLPDACESSKEDFMNHRITINQLIDIVYVNGVKLNLL